MGMGKVGKGGRGRDEGYGKWVELAELPTLHLKPNSIFTSRCDNDRTKFIIKFIGKHVSFNMTFYYPFPLLGMVVWDTWCCRDLCPCDRECLEEIWLL